MDTEVITTGTEVVLIDCINEIWQISWEIFV